MMTRKQIEQAVSDALAAVADDTGGVTSDRLLESYGITDDTAIEVEHFLENELQFGFRDDLTLRPDMTVEQACSVVERCLRADGDFAPEEKA